MQSKQLVYFQTENSSWPTRSFCSLFTKRYTPQKVFISNNMPICSFFPSNYIDCQLFVARTKLKYNVRYIYSTTARPEQTQYQPVLKSDKQGTWRQFTSKLVLHCARLRGLQGWHVPDSMPQPISRSSTHGLVGDCSKNQGAAWRATALAACWATRSSQQHSLVDWVCN